MRKIFIMLALVSSLFASSIDWPNNYEAALKQATLENKKVYLFITSDYCKWCREFEDTTLKDEKILALLEKDYVVLHLSKERDAIDERFMELSFVPKHFFLEANGEKIYEDYGYRTEDYFKNILNDIKEDD